MLDWLFGRGKRVTTKKRRPARFSRLCCEQLEDRLVPAGGVVTVTVVAGTLTLTGDGNAMGNDVRLLEQGVGQYDVQGQNGTQVKLGAGGTPQSTVSVSNVGNNGLGDIKATFFDGPDVFTYSGLFVGKLRDMVLNMGKGADNVNVSSFDIRNLIITQGVGDVSNDQVSVAVNLNMNGQIRGLVAINNGGGNDTTTLALKVGSNVTVNNSGGGDTTLITNNSYIGGSLSVLNTTPLMGAATNDTRIEGSSFISKNVTIRNVTVVNSATVDADNQINNSYVGGTLIITNGNAGVSVNSNTISSSTVGGSVSTTGTTGDDRTFVMNSSVGRTVIIRSGNGPGEAQLQNSTVGGSFITVMGTGNDHVAISGSVVFGNISLNLGNASSSNIVNIDALTVFGLTTIIGAINGDEVYIDHSTFTGAVAISTGAGNDIVSVGFFAPTPNTFFHSSLNINVGTGTDQINLGSSVRIRVSGPATYSGTASTTLTDPVGPFDNIYLSTRTKVGIP